VDIQEERRLLYVAMTRAKHELRLSCALTPVPRFGAPQLSEPSQFLAESNFVSEKANSY